MQIVITWYIKSSIPTNSFSAVSSFVYLLASPDHCYYSIFLFLCSSNFYLPKWTSQSYFSDCKMSRKCNWSFQLMFWVSEKQGENIQGKREVLWYPHFSCSPTWFIHHVYPRTSPQPMNQTYSCLTGTKCPHCLCLSHVTVLEVPAHNGQTFYWGVYYRSPNLDSPKAKQEMRSERTPGTVLPFTSQRMFHRAVGKPNLTRVSLSEVPKVTCAPGQRLLLQPTLLRGAPDSRGYLSLLFRGCSP